MYVAVKGGEAAIGAAHRLLAEARRGDLALPELTVEQIAAQLSLAVDRVMAEGSLYDRELAALAVKQARGDLVEAIFLLRAYRTTLPRLALSRPIDTGAMRCRRRISAIFKDLPGGQLLGPTFDYTHRLLDFELLENPLPPQGGEGRVRGASGQDEASPDPHSPAPTLPSPASGGGSRRGWAAPSPAVRERGDDAMPHVTDLLGRQGLIEPEAGAAEPAGDLTREPLAFPAPRGVRLQNLARGDEGFLLAVGYSTQRGYGNNHPFAGEIRCGAVEVEIVPEELGFPVTIGEVVVTECEMVNQFKGSATVPPEFTRGYGLAFGEGERKAMAMALVDRALRAEELGEAADA
ncbi:MAG TPA: carbon-phosphorus lyase complex subunit PhnI, partial [Stellaceae bacterium]|nr:carbon-phosphorus lyase complex subunit PhnI [Stellaceae bacterium]